ncbi:MAG: hypothetical protein J6Q70_02905 [Clostridia bacterium]|nr:hypothetical protein [Clostridia bacterium]
MKKNVMMRVASALLVAVLMTTGAISGTFAKYTTSDTATATARVAKWGVTVDVTGETAFAEKYDNEASATGVKVVSDTKVVAPGTNGKLGGITIGGETEVMVDVVVTADLELTGWEIDGVEYCPIVFTVGSTEIKIDGSTITDVAGLEAAVEKVFTDLSKDDVDANTDLSDTVSVSWKWDFYTSDANDEKDTALAELPTAPEISFTCEVTVTQVD